jgi:hypothetical protein
MGRIDGIRKSGIDICVALEMFKACRKAAREPN